MSTKTFCYCANCKCSGYCFYSNNRKEIDYKLLDSIVIDAACHIAHCQFISDTTPAPEGWQGYEPGSRLENTCHKSLATLRLLRLLPKSLACPLSLKSFLPSICPTILLTKMIYMCKIV